MIDDRSSALLRTIGQSMLAAAPERRWREIVLDVTGAGPLTGTTLAVVNEDDTEDRFVDIGDEGEDACDELRDVMYAEGKGTWYNARIVVSSDRQVHAEFDYDAPPFGGSADRDLLIEDQTRYRRDEEHLPAWHPLHVIDES